jgi:chemotaxis protein methyltransferase CheR
MSLMVPVDPDLRLSEEEFRLVRDMIRDYCGLSFAADAGTLLARRLAKRMTLLGIGDFREYYRLIRYGRDRDQEMSDLIDLLTTNETYFFREVLQLRALTDEIIPELLQRRGERSGETPLRIWSAGCSTGEEPYTVAMLLLETGCCEGVPVEIIGTDISHRVLQQARRGIYGDSAFRATDGYFQQKYFRREEKGYRIVDTVRDLVTISHLNLLDESRLALIGRVDIIFCRNVMIYFDRPVRVQVAGAFFGALREGGYLLLGHADSLMNITTAFSLRHLAHDMVYQRPLKHAGNGQCEK